jgi:hypothetical protein
MLPMFNSPAKNFQGTMLGYHFRRHTYLRIGVHSPAFEPVPPAGKQIVSSMIHRLCSHGESTVRLVNRRRGVHHGKRHVNPRDLYVSVGPTHLRLSFTTHGPRMAIVR